MADKPARQKTLFKEKTNKNVLDAADDYADALKEYNAASTKKKERLALLILAMVKFKCPKHKLSDGRTAKLIGKQGVKLEEVKAK